MPARLVDRSLIHRDAPGRFEFHKLLQQFAEAKLNASQNADAVRRRHLDVFARLAIEGEKAWRGSSDQLTWSKRLEQEQPNIRAAIEWGIQHDPEGAARLAGANWLFYYSRGYLREAQQIYDQLLGLIERLPDGIKGWLYNGRCSVALAQKDWWRPAAAATIGGRRGIIATFWHYLKPNGETWRRRGACCKLVLQRQTT